MCNEVVSNVGLKTGIDWSSYDLLQFSRLIGSLSLLYSKIIYLFDGILNIVVSNWLAIAITVL